MSSPNSFYVISDNYGYVTTYTSISDVQHLTNKYPTLSFLVQRFDVSDGPLSPIWVVLYRDIDAVAFVSNNRETAITVKGEYNKIGLSYVDEIDYWQRELGVIDSNTEDRLESFSRANTMYIGTSAEDIALREAEDMSRLQRLTEGSVMKINVDDTKITIFDCVEPVGVGGSVQRDEHPQLDLSDLTSSIPTLDVNGNPILDVNGNPIEESPPIVFKNEANASEEETTSIDVSYAASESETTIKSESESDSESYKSDSMK